MTIPDFHAHLQAEDKDELFVGALGESFDIGKLSVGYIRDFPCGNTVLGLGALGSAYTFPSELEPFYGKNPLSFMELQDVQEVTNFFERRVSAYQVGISGEVAFDATF